MSLIFYCLVFASNFKWQRVGSIIARGAQNTAPSSPMNLSRTDARLIPKYAAERHIKNLDSFLTKFLPFFYQNDFSSSLSSYLVLFFGGKILFKV
jgi:hypothetical protein